MKKLKSKQLNDNFGDMAKQMHFNIQTRREIFERTYLNRK